MRKLLSVPAAALLAGCASMAGAGNLATVAVTGRSTGAASCPIRRDRDPERRLRSDRPRLSKRENGGTLGKFGDNPD